MVLFIYDKTFEGLLTALFHAYSRNTFPEKLLAEKESLPLFYDEVVTIYTDDVLADRVWKGLERLLPAELLSGVTACWLSELPHVDELLFRYLRKIFDSKGKCLFNLGDADVLEVNKVWKKVSNECSRVIQFTRFQKTIDGIYFSASAPIYNVLPLTLGYFKDRFADQFWLLYDLKRQYGYYYDLQEVREVRFEQTAEHLLSGVLPCGMLDQEELLFQQLWQTYFKSIAIKERINLRLHRQQMPARFWPYLTEKRKK